MATDIDRLRELLEQLPPDDYAEALNILLPIEASFSTYELPYLVSNMAKGLVDSNPQKAFKFLKSQVPLVRDACSLYSTKGGNPTGSLRVVAIDALAIQDMIEATVQNRNFMSDLDLITFSENLNTWSKGRVNGVGKKCCSPISTCHNCSTSFLEASDNVRSAS